MKNSKFGEEMEDIRVPAIEKLVDYVAMGIGGVAGTLLAPWKANREGKAELIRARTEADKLKIIAQAQSDAQKIFAESDAETCGKYEIGKNGVKSVIEFQQKKRVENTLSVANFAAADLGNKEVPNHKPDPDKAARFFDYIQDISSEEMQKRWGKLLAGELEKPGSVSLLTLSIFKNLGKREAEMFESLGPYLIGNDHFLFSESQYAKKHYGDLLHLRDYGLVDPTPSLQHTFHFTPNNIDEQIYIFLSYSHTLLKICLLDKQNYGAKRLIEIPSYGLSIPGKELTSIIKERRVEMVYLKEFGEFLRRKGYGLSILGRSGSGIGSTFDPIA